MDGIAVVLNPAAGRGAAGRRRGEIEAALRGTGVPFTIQQTHARGGATELAWQAIEGGAHTVVAVGGDGTINEVVNGIKGAETTTKRRARLAIIPLGTGSDFIKALDGMLANDIAGGVQRATAGRVRPLDLGLVRVNDDAPRYFINAVGAGFDAQVAAESIKIHNLTGFAVYLLSIARALRSYRTDTMTVEYEQQRVSRRLMFANVGNGRCQAAGLWMTPDALLDDGLLDLCLVDNLRLDQIVRYLPLLMRGKHTMLPVVTMGRTAKLTITPRTPVPVQADGEVISEHARHVVIENVPRAIDLLIA